MPENMDVLTTVYARNIDAVYRLCYVYLRSRADAEDAAQSVFVKYLQKQPAFQNADHETAWLLLTAKNCCRDQLRCRWRRQRIDMDMIPEPVMQETEVSELLETLLSLPEKYRIPLYLHSIEGYPAKELASLLGCRESTVRTRLQRGREIPKQRLGGIYDDDEKIQQMLGPTEPQKQRMLRGIREKHDRLRTPRRKTLRIALICAALCVLIGTSAFAAVSFGLMDGLRTFLQSATPEQEELLAQGAYVVDKSDSNANGTLEVKQVIGDSNLVYLLLEFTAPEDTVLDLDGYRFSGSLNVGQQTTGAGFVKIADEDENDNRMTLVMCEPTREPVVGKRAKLMLSDLEGANVEEEYQTVLSGSWSVSFPLDFEDCSVTYPMAQTISVEGYDMTLQSISVSPLSITLRANSPYTREIIRSLDEKYAPYSENEQVQ